MNAESDLLRAVLESPWDDLPRVVFADWCDENSRSEQAAFIRAQINLAKRGTPFDSFPCSLFNASMSQEEHDRIHGLLDVHHVYLETIGKEPNVTYRRGFIDELHTTMAEFIGGPCIVCDESGYERFRVYDGTEEGDTQQEECSNCKGSGSIPGLVREVCAKWPLTKIVFSDKRPVLIEPHSGDEFAGRWIWWQGDGIGDDMGEAPYDLIPEAFKKDVWNFSTKDEALEALSRAAISLSRKCAGLPEMRWV